MKQVKEHPLLGRKYSEVQHTHKFRVVRIDKEGYGLTMDYNPTRMNVEVDNDIITKVYYG